MSNNPRSRFFCLEQVKLCKKPILKERIQTLIKSKGISESEFYNKIGLSRQYWYYISWGIWKPTTELRIKIARELGVDSSVIFQDGHDE